MLADEALLHMPMAFELQEFASMSSKTYPNAKQLPTGITSHVLTRIRWFNSARASLDLACKDTGVSFCNSSLEKVHI